jgi:hypothetical protein
VRSVLFDLGANIYNTSLQYLICSYRNQANGPSPCRNHGGRGRDGMGAQDREGSEQTKPASLTALGALLCSHLRLALLHAACFAARVACRGLDFTRCALHLARPCGRMS